MHILTIYIIPIILAATIARQHYKRRLIIKQLKRWHNPSKGLWQHADDFYELQAKIEKL